VTCAFALAADSPYVGKWSINKAESKVDPNGTKIESLTLHYVQDGPTLKYTSTTNGTTAPTIILDGEEHAITPTPGSSPNRMGATHYVSTVHGNNIQTVFKKDGKTVGTRKATMSADGKRITSITEGTGGNGQKVQSTLVFDKQ
jgi:hypothetical protein